MTLDELILALQASSPQAVELEAHAALLLRCVEALRVLPQLDAAAPLMAVFVPGRVEVFGKHTDYAGGRSLLIAVEKGFALVAVPRSDNLVRLVAAPFHEAAPADRGQVPRSGATADLEIKSFLFDADLRPEPGHWHNYPMTVARRLARNFGPALGRPLRGADMAFTSSLPAAAGLSSSSALIIATFMALAEANRLAEAPLYAEAIRSTVDLATYLATIENGQSFGPLAGDRGVGTFGGSEDHTIILGGQRGRLSQYSFAPTRAERELPWPDDMVFVIGASGVLAEKTGARLGDYNRLAQQVSVMVGEFNAARGAECRTLRDCLDALEADDPKLEHFFAHLVSMKRELAALDLPGRAMQFREETEVLIPQAVEAVVDGDWRRFGELADRSHELADHCLRNQVAETNALQGLARESGAVAASGFGAGFGGSVWAVVSQRAAPRFTERWQSAYAKAFPEMSRRARFFTTQPAGGAHVVVDLPEGFGP